MLDEQVLWNLYRSNSK